MNLKEQVVQEARTLSRKVTEEEAHAIISGNGKWDFIKGYAFALLNPEGSPAVEGWPTEADVKRELQKYNPPGEYDYSEGNAPEVARAILSLFPKPVPSPAVEGDVVERAAEQLYLQDQINYTVGDRVSWLCLPEEGPTKTKCRKIAKTVLEAAGLLSPVSERERALEKALNFYRSEWRTNMEGDGETPGLSRCWQEPTDELCNDAGMRARIALETKSPATPALDGRKLVPAEPDVAMIGAGLQGIPFSDGKILPHDIARIIRNAIAAAPSPTVETKT